MTRSIGPGRSARRSGPGPPRSARPGRGPGARPDPAGARRRALARPFGGRLEGPGPARRCPLGLLITLMTLPLAAWPLPCAALRALHAVWGAWAADLVKSFWCCGDHRAGTARLVCVAAVRAALVVDVGRWPPRVSSSCFVRPPLLVEPLFNKFTPMAGGPLRTS